jgi:hypothetical protein
MIHEIAIKFGMEQKGDALFHDENFRNHHNLPCYIPANVEDRHDIYSRNDIHMKVREWLDKEGIEEYLLETYDGTRPVIDDKFINEWVVNVYQNLSWQHPSTFLENLLF